MRFFWEADVNETPQEYYFRSLGGPNLRKWFADWAGQVAAKMDFLTRDQFQVTVDNCYNHHCVRNKLWQPYVWKSTDSGTQGWVRPKEDRTTRGWSFNVWRIINSRKANYMYVYTIIKHN